MGEKEGGLGDLELHAEVCGGVQYPDKVTTANSEDAGRVCSNIYFVMKKLLLLTYNLTSL